MHQWRTVIAAACVVMATGSAAGAATSPEAKCASAQRKAAAKKAAAYLNCHARARRTGDAVDPDCLTAADTKFQTAFAKAGTACPGSADDVELLLKAMTTTLADDVPGFGACPSASLKSIGKGASRRLTCAAKEVSKPESFTACADKAEAKLAAALTAAGSCGQAPTIPADLRAGELRISRSAAPSPLCCDGERITLKSGPGTIKLGGLFAFPYPAGTITVVDTAAPDGACRHDAVVPAGGFFMPPACMPALSYTFQAVATGCSTGTGTGLGRGVVWDGNSGTNGGVPQANVTKAADSSDGNCDNTGAPCVDRDQNTLGHVGTTWDTGGDGNQASTRLDLPTRFRIWQDSSGCPGDGIYNPADGDVIISEFDAIVSPTTATATAQFADENANGCALPGGSMGFGSPSVECGAGSAGPCSAVGAEARGPCCVVGQTQTLASVGISFTNSFPFYDLGFISSSPNTVMSCGSPGADACDITSDACVTFGSITTTTTSTTTTTIGPCCGAERTTLTSTGGTLRLGGFSPFPMPAGVAAVLDSGPPDDSCRHDVTLPAGGFVVPAFCIPSLFFTAQITPTGCTSGAGVGRGVMWDGNAAGQAGVPQADVSKSGDSSDGLCDGAAVPCADRDQNTLGSIDTTISTGGDPTKVTTRLDVPVHIRLWVDAAGCPGNGVYNPAEGDTPIFDADAVLSPTTATATAQFADKNGDACVLPGGSFGFGCGTGALGPCSATGSPRPGPCCQVGDVETQVAAGVSFSNNFPMWDVGFVSSITGSVTSCGSPGADACVFAPDPCRGL